MVEKFRFAVGLALIWLTAVAGVSATAWFAIDRAGRDVGGGGLSALLPIPVSKAGAGARPPYGLIRAPSATPGPATTRVSSVPPSPAPATTAAPVPPPRGSPARTVRSTPTGDRTFTGAGGRVSVRCTGARITLRIAQPDNGWRVEVHKSSSRDIEFRFQRVNDNSGSGTRMVTVCEEGVPALRVDNKG